MAQITWALRRTPQGFEGLIRLPKALITCPRASQRAGRRVVRKGPIAIKAKGASRADALAQAADVADHILSNPIVRAAMPPGTGAAVQATKLIAKHGPKALKAITGKGAKRLAKALKFW